MEITKTILLTVFTFVTTLGFCQSQLKNVIELNYEIGISNDYGKLDSYNSFVSFGVINIVSRKFIRATNRSINFIRYINPKNGIKLTFGKTKFGFDFEGVDGLNNTRIKGNFQTIYNEFGLSYIRRILIWSNTKLLLEPGIRYHTDATPNFDTLFVRVKESFSLSSYVGFELPMAGDRFFASAGLQIRLPLQKYDYADFLDGGYYPYFVGVKVGVNYQF